MEAQQPTATLRSVGRKLFPVCYKLLYVYVVLGGTVIFKPPMQFLDAVNYARDMPQATVSSIIYATIAILIGFVLNHIVYVCTIGIVAVVVSALKFALRTVQQVCLLLSVIFT